MLQDRLPSNDEGYIGLEQDKVDKDSGRKGKGRQSLGCSLVCRTA